MVNRLLNEENLRVSFEKSMSGTKVSKSEDLRLEAPLGAGTKVSRKEKALKNDRETLKNSSKASDSPRAQKKELPPKPVPKPAKKVKIVKTFEKDEVEDEDEVNEVKVREPRKRATIEGHIEKYDKILALLDSEIDRKSREKEKGARAFRKVRKIVVQMRKELPVVTRSKAARMQSSLRKGTTSGITIQCQISEELANFLKVPPETRISRVDATRALCAYAHWKDDEKREEILRWQHLNPTGKRNLQNPQDKKSIIPDKALVKLLRYENYKKDIKNGKVTKKIKDKETGKTNVVQMTDDTLYYWVIQKLITIHFLKDDAASGADEIVDE